MTSLTQSNRSDVDVDVIGGEVVSEYNCMFSFDAKFLYCPSGNVIKVFNVTTGRFCGQLEGHKDRITTLTTNERNHLQLISGGLDGYLVVWDIGTEYSAIKTVEIGRPIYKVGQLKCFANNWLVVLNDSANGRYFVADSNTCSTNTDSMLFSFGRFDPKSVSFGFETNVVAAIDSPRKLLVWCAELSRTVGIAVPSFRMSFSGVAVHPTDRNVVAACTSVGRIYIWGKVFATNDGTAAAPSFHLHWHSNILRSLAFSPEGTFLFSGGEECVFVKWLWRKQQRSFIPRLGAPIRSIALSPDGAIYALGLTDNTIAVISSNMTLMRPIRSFVTGTGIPAIRPKLPSPNADDTLPQLSPAGLLFDRRSHAVIANSRPGHLQFFDVENRRNVILLDVTAENYVSGGDNLLPVTEVVKADITTDGCWLGTVQSRGDVENECTLKIWQFEEKSRMFSVNTLSSRAHLDAITSLRFSSFSPSAKDVEDKNLRLITTSADGFFRLWRCHKQLVDGQQQQSQLYRWHNVFSSSYHSIPIFDADWSADGSLVALAAGAYVLLVDGNADGKMETTKDSMDTDWLLSVLTADLTSRIANLKFGRHEDSSYIVGCSNDNEGFVCVWNVTTSQMTWKISFLSPHIASDPSSSYMAVLSGAAVQQKNGLLFKPSTPSTENSFAFELPSVCSNSLASKMSPITSVLFLPKDQKSESDSSILSQSNLYFLTGDQKLYVISLAPKPSEVCEDVKSRFRFSSPSIASSGSIPQSALASLLSLGRVTLNESVKDEDNSASQTVAKSTLKYDPLFETPPHLLPPVSRISSEFLLRRCAELCGVIPDSVDNSDALIESPSVSTTLLADQNTSTTNRSDFGWIREVM